MKECSACKAVKPLGDFSKNASSSDGLKYRCKKCDVIYHRAYREANLEKIKLSKAEYYQENKEACLRRSRKRREEKPELVKAEYKAAVEKNKERVTAYKHAWYEKNKERLLQEGKQRYLALSDEKRASRNAKSAKWKRDNPEARCADEANRRARKRDVGGTHTAEDIKDILEIQKYKCVVCRVSLRKKHHIDHIVPLAKGGDNSPLNLQALCPTCNLRKNCRDPVEFMQSNGFLL